MNDTTDELNYSGAQETLADTVTDEQLEAAADPAKPALWTYASAEYSQACCSY